MLKTLEMRLDIEKILKGPSLRRVNRSQFLDFIWF